jgi:hypothetical protein
MQYFWFVTLEYYRVMNKILGSSFNDQGIMYFINNEPDGIYVTLQTDETGAYKYWGFMPYHHPDDKKESRKWLEDHDYEFKYEISRKSKLEMINKIYKI